MYRIRNNQPEVLLVHPGGPFWQKKDAGAWTIPKGEIEEGETDELAVAKREFEEETGLRPEGNFIALTSIKQKGGKTVAAWALEGDFDTSKLKSNTFRMPWPPRSEELQEFPEVDRAQWFSPAEARLKINPAQIPLIEELIEILKTKG